MLHSSRSQPAPRRSHSRFRRWFSAILTTTCVALTVQAETVTLQYEMAPSLNGPWSKVDLNALVVHPDGTTTVDSQLPKTYFRLQILQNGQQGTFPILPLADLPPRVLDLAKAQLGRISGNSNLLNGEWSDIAISPFVCPVGDPSGGAGSGLVELKLISKPKNPRAIRGFRPNASDDESCDRGFLLMSLDRSNLPLLEFSTEGLTKGEQLLKRCGTQTPAKILRFSPTFWAAEDAEGRLIGNQGTEPFFIPHAYSNIVNRRFTGVIDSETGVSNVPAKPTGIRNQPYRSYAEMKRDFQVNPVIETMRKRRAEYARLQWDLEDGKQPQILQVRVGQAVSLLPGKQVDNVTLHWEEPRSLADVSPIPRLGGIRVVGLIPGSAPLIVRIDEKLEQYVLHVLPAGIVGGLQPSLAGIEAPHWETKVEAYAGNWSDQRHWYQLRDSSDWCDLVGCGPTALAMLFGWWDAKGVPSAFYKSLTSFESMSQSDAPADLSTSGRKAIVRGAYKMLHEQCDVICNPFGDDGATLPEDLIEGYYSYVHQVSSGIGLGTIMFSGFNKPLVGHSCSWAYDFWGDDWEESGSRVATGIKNGRPGVIGLGWLWHYAVAYGYIREELVADLGSGEINLGTRRWLKCNEGWKNSSPSWYSAYDVFLGLTTRMWQKNTAHNPN
jgi:hypothetical protein